VPSTPHLGEPPEAGEPPEQLVVAGGTGGKGLDAEQAADGVHGRRHMDVEVGVDAANHGAFSFYDGHGHPFSSFGQGVARPSPEGVTVVSALRLQGGPSPLWNGTRRSCRALVDNATKDSSRRQPGWKVRPRSR